MQKLNKVRVPEGKKAFASALFSNFGKKEVLFDTFLTKAHKYGDEEMAQALRSVLSLPQASICKKAKSLGHPAVSIIDQPEMISSKDSMLDASRRFVIARNAYIPYYLVGRYYDYIFDPYQEVCRNLVSCESKELKVAYLDMLGIMGNALPAAEKRKLGTFLVEYMKAEGNVGLKIAATVALAFLLDPQAPFAILNEAESAGDTYQATAYRSALIISTIKNPVALELLLPKFLFGNYCAEVKLAAALLMITFGKLEFYEQVLQYMRTVDVTVAEFQKIALAKAKCKWYTEEEVVEHANESLWQYYVNNKFINDIDTYSALSKYISRRNTENEMG